MRMPKIPTNILNWWRQKLADEKRRLADIEAGTVPGDEKTIRHLRRMIPRLEKNLDYAERINADRT